MLFCTYSWWNPSHTLWGGWGRWYYLHLVRWGVQAQNVREGLTLTGRVPPRHRNPSPQSPSHFPSCGATPPSQGEGTAVWCPGAHRADLSSNPTPVSWGSSFHSCKIEDMAVPTHSAYLRRIGRTSEVKLTLLRTQPGTQHSLLISASALNAVYHTAFFFFFPASGTELQRRSHRLWTHGLHFLQDIELFWFYFFYDQCLKIGRLNRKLKISQISWNMRHSTVILGPHSYMATICWTSAETPPLENTHAHQLTPVPTTP